MIETAVVRREGVMDAQHKYEPVRVWVRAWDDEADVWVVVMAADEQTATDNAVSELNQMIAEKDSN